MRSIPVEQNGMHSKLTVQITFCWYSSRVHGRLVTNPEKIDSTITATRSITPTALRKIDSRSSGNGMFGSALGSEGSVIKINNIWYAPDQMPVPIKPFRLQKSGETYLALACWSVQATPKNKLTILSITWSPRYLQMNKRQCRLQVCHSKIAKVIALLTKFSHTLSFTIKLFVVGVQKVLALRSQANDKSGLYICGTICLQTVCN